MLPSVPDAGPRSISEMPMVENIVAEILPSSLELLSAEPLCRRLQGRLLSAQPVALDGSQVERISTPCIQIPVAAATRADASGGPITLKATANTLVGGLSV